MRGEQQVHRGSADEWAAQGSAPLPPSVQIAIVGGGIVGCSAAYFLARHGVSVALFEKGRIAGEQSGRNWGWVRQQGRSAIELPLMMRSLHLWQELARDLPEDVGFRQGGCLYLAEDAAQLAELGQWLPIARAHDLDTRLLDAHALAGILKSDGRKWAGRCTRPATPAPSPVARRQPSRVPRNAPVRASSANARSAASSVLPVGWTQ